MLNSEITHVDLHEYCISTRRKINLSPFPQAIVAAASDEIYPQTYYNYDIMGLLCQGAEEDDYRIRPEEAKRKVLGEGAGALVLETAPSALDRRTFSLNGRAGIVTPAPGSPRRPRCS